MSSLVDKLIEESDRRVFEVMHRIVDLVVEQTIVVHTIDK